MLFYVQILSNFSEFKKIPQFQIFEIYQIMAILWVKLENCEKIYFFDEGSIFFFFFLV